jgi:ubiquitin C-terminal hydrolase
LLVEWDELRKLMWSENCTISPGKFLNTIQTVANIKDKHIFTGFAQNDLPEFLLFIIDCFHNAIKHEVNMKIQGTPVNKKDNLAIKCYKMIETMYKKEYSEILKLFYGCHVSQIISENNEILSETPEPFSILNLPIPNISNPSLQDCFDMYTLSERMDGDNQWFNEKTQSKEDVFKKIMFFNLPTILIIDLKRFTNMGRKNKIFVDFQLENMDLSKYIIGYKQYSHIYDLYGICNHFGSALGGHYTSYVKNNIDDCWYDFNDTNVTKINDVTKLKTSNAYCFFYRKKKILH